MAKIPAGGLAHRGAFAVRRSSATQRRLLRFQAAAEAKGQISLDLREGKRQEVHTELARIGQLGEGLPAGATLALLDGAPWKCAPREQLAVRMFPTGMSHEEIGYVLGLRKQTVQKAERRALEKLRDRLGLTEEDVRDLLRIADERGRRVLVPQ